MQNGHTSLIAKKYLNVSELKEKLVDIENSNNNEKNDSKYHVNKEVIENLARNKTTKFIQYLVIFLSRRLKLSY